jgi:glycosyltransferase involved in cell wall biosynthesis
VVAPLIDGRQVVHVGEADARQKRDLYRHASCLLVPIKWEEPFGLVMAEAMACGTPVIAMNRGAAPEIVRHGVTGFIVNTVEEMADAVRRLTEIDPRMCRRHVAANFDVPHLVARYLELYEQVLERESARALPTTVRPGRPGLAAPSIRAA